MMNIEQTIEHLSIDYIDIQNGSFYGERGFRIGSWRAGVRGGAGCWGRPAIRKEIPYAAVLRPASVANDERPVRPASRRSQ